MAIRVVYILNSKEPDIIEGATGWVFRDGLVKIFDDRGFTVPMIEIRDDYVLSVEHLELRDEAKKALEAPETPPEGREAPENTP